MLRCRIRRHHTDYNSQLDLHAGERLIPRRAAGIEGFKLAGWERQSGRIANPGELSLRIDLHFARHIYQLNDRNHS